MRKKLFASAFAGLVAISAFGEVTTVTYSYASADAENLAAYGKGRKESMDVAMCIDDPTLAGMKITGVRAYINTTDVENTSIWMTRALTLDGKTNIPDLMSEEVAVEEGEYAGEPLGLLSLKLDNAVELNSDPIYVGFSMTVPDNATYEQKNPLVIYNSQNPNGFWFHTSSSVMKWTNYVQTAGGVVVILVDIEGNFPTNCLSVKSIPEAFAIVGEDFELAVEMTNSGATAVSNVDYTYTINGETKSAYYELAEPISPNPAYAGLVNLPISAINATGSYPINVTINKINGETNESEYASGEGVVYGIESFPKHRPLVEEYTGLWCGNCPRGYIGMELLGELLGDDVVIVCYHNGDPMQVTDVYPMPVTGYPQASIDRVSLIDPYYGDYYTHDDDFGIKIDVEETIKQQTIGDINILSAVLNGTDVNITAEASFIKNMTDAKYYVGYVLVANGLTSDKWGQVNYYAGDRSLAGTYMEEAAEWPATVYGLIYNDVAVNVRAMGGVANSIPSDITIGEAYSNSYTISIANNPVIQNNNNLVIAAYIIDGNTGRIVNANKLPVANPAGVGSINADAKVVATEYYDLTGRKVVEPTNGIFVKVDKLSNGNSRTSKVTVK